MLTSLQSCCPGIEYGGHHPCSCGSPHLIIGPTAAASVGLTAGGSGFDPDGRNGAFRGAMTSRATWTKTLPGPKARMRSNSAVSFVRHRWTTSTRLASAAQSTSMGRRDPGLCAGRHSVNDLRGTGERHGRARAAYRRVATDRNVYLWQISWPAASFRRIRKTWLAIPSGRFS